MSECIIDISYLEKEHPMMFGEQPTALMGCPLKEKIIRCKDCWHMCVNTIRCNNAEIDRWLTCVKFGINVKENDFCAWGKAVNDGWCE